MLIFFILCPCSIRQKCLEKKAYHWLSGNLPLWVKTSILYANLTMAKTDIGPNLTVRYSNTHPSSAMSFIKGCPFMYFIFSYFSPFSFCPICDSANAVLCTNFWNNQGTAMGYRSPRFFPFCWKTDFEWKFWRCVNNDWVPEFRLCSIPES